MEQLRRLVQELALAGYQLDRTAYDYLKTMDEPEASTFAKNVLLSIGDKPNTSHILSRQELLEIPTHPPLESAQVQASVTRTIPAKQISPRLEILRDPSKEIGTGGNIDDFSHYFRDRFHKLSRAFRERSD